MHVIGPRFLIRKTRETSVRLEASKALSARARLMITKIEQRISLLVVVKKKIILTAVRYVQLAQLIVE
jgi:hypothetical protein